MAEQKEAPPVEVSLKYMAWNIKEMSENVKKITMCLEQYFGDLKNQEPHKPVSKAYNDTTPF